MGDVIPFGPGAAPAGDADPALLEDVEAFAARTAREPFWLDAVEIPEPFRAALRAALERARRDLEPGRR
jgi:hypothetical protein